MYKRWREEANVAGLQRGRAMGGGYGVGQVSIAIKKIVPSTGCCQWGELSSEDRMIQGQWPGFPGTPENPLYVPTRPRQVAD